MSTTPGGTGATPDGSLPAWLDDPALATCWARVRSRFEANGLVPSGRTVVELGSRAERHAVGALLGSPLTRGRVTVDLAVLDTRLRERSGLGGLDDVLPLVTGAPLRDRPGHRAELTRRREAPLELAAQLTDEPWARPWRDAWLAGLRATGLLTNRPDSLAIVRQAGSVLSVLIEDMHPVVGRSRVELAARTVGDSHALDEDRLLTQVVIRGLAAAADLPVPATSAERRDVWEHFGVAPDLLSRTCLTLGLKPGGTGSVSRRLRLAAEAGDPVHLTAWDLRRLEGGRSADGSILVCENPRVLEAVAERHGSTQAVVCTSGEPNTVVTALLQRLADAGHPLRYHGDFDWPGVAIANRLVPRFGVLPWRMSLSDYEESVRRDGPVLVGVPVEPCWDPELGAGMRAHARAVHEESVLPTLLASLPG